MSDLIFIFIFVLLALAIVLREDFVLVLLYLMVGAYFVGRIWGSRGLKSLLVHRDFPKRAFLGEEIDVHINISNSSWVPLAWLQLREQIPVSFSPSGTYKQVMTVGPKGSVALSYHLDCRRRGYYPLGPLDLYSSDVLGLTKIQQVRFGEEFLTVYPRIIPLSVVRIPSNAPLGTLRHTQPMFDDPSKVRGKRDYVSGDSLRRVDWKASAVIGRLQVKLYEPSIALETMIFLNLNIDDFQPRRRFDISELSIVISASLANWIIGKRQSVGLVTNGVDPYVNDKIPPVLAPNRGRGHLLRILEVLARLRVAETIPFMDLLERGTSGLAWGTTLILISNYFDDNVFDGLFRARRSGLNAFLIQCGPSANYLDIRKRASYFNFPIHEIYDEADLDIWRT